MKGFQVIILDENHFICTQCGDWKHIQDQSQPGKYSFHCSECHLFNRRCNYYKNKERDLQTVKDYVVKNLEKTRTYQLNWKKENYQKVRKIANKHRRKKRLIDPSFKIACNLRNRIGRIVKGRIKNGSSVKDLGCSIEELKQHLESKFTEGMTWHNYGRWHIDHIKPLSKFDLTNKDEFLKACHYTNLQPLWAVDNIKKSNFI